MKDNKERVNKQRTKDGTKESQNGRKKKRRNPDTT